MGKTSGYNRHRRLYNAIIIIVLILLFLGSIAIAIFSGDEIQTTMGSTVSPAKGMFRITNGSYRTSYFNGDPFVFDKEDSEVMLIARDPLIENLVRIDDLPGEEYGFSVNGDGKIYDDASDIVMTADVESVSIVSKVYPEISLDLGVSVLGDLDVDRLASRWTYEAEDADLYDAVGNLIDQATKEDVPYLSNFHKTNATAGVDCSGGASLMNISSGISVVIEVVCAEDCEAELTVKHCLRNEGGKIFGDYFDFTLNGEPVTSVTEQETPQSNSSDYFIPHSLDTVTVSLVRGVNTFRFTALGSTVNLDAIDLETENAVLGDLSAVVFNARDEEAGDEVSYEEAV